MTDPSRHYTYVEELERYVTCEWWDYDAFKHLNYTAWDVIFPRGANPPTKGKKWVYETGYNGDQIRREGLDTAQNLLQANVKMDKPWTSFLASSPGHPSTVFFVFLKEEDAVKFLLFNTITSLKRFVELP